MKDLFKNLKSYQDPVYWDTEEKKLKFLKISDKDRHVLVVVTTVACALGIGLLYTLACTILGLSR